MHKKLHVSHRLRSNFQVSRKLLHVQVIAQRETKVLEMAIVNLALFR